MGEFKILGKKQVGLSAGDIERIIFTVTASVEKKFDSVNDGGQ